MKGGEPSRSDLPTTARVCAADRPQEVRQPRLAAGLTFSDEPELYIPGELGIRHEDTLAVTPDGCENLVSPMTIDEAGPTGVKRAR